MRPLRRAPANSNRTSCRRLVKHLLLRRSVRDATFLAVRSEEWEARVNGLRAADILQHQFPGFSAAHVSGRPATPKHLLGAVQALVSLVEALGVELPDTSDIRTDRDNPAAALDRLPSFVRTDDDALGALESCRWMLEALRPVVYGQVHEVEPLFEGGEQNLLALMLWILADQTSWSLTSGDIADIVDYAIGEIKPERAAFAGRIDRLRLEQWPGNLLMHELAKRLDRVTCNGTNLGAAVRYVFSATGLQFADLSLEELDEMGWTGMDWHTVDFGHVAERQAEARQVAQHYYDLDNLVSADPVVFDAVVAALGDAVKATLQAARRREQRKARAVQAGGAAS
jgi:hypothetical protein